MTASAALARQAAIVSRSQPGPVGPGQPVVDVDPLGCATERGEGDALRGEILIVADLRERRWGFGSRDYRSPSGIVGPAGGPSVVGCRRVARRNRLLHSAGLVRLNAQLVRRVARPVPDRAGEVGSVAGRAVGRVVVPTVVWAVLTSASAVAVNLATEWKTNTWAWLAVAVTTALVASVALWLDRRQTAAAVSGTGGGQSVSHSTIGRDNIQIGRARDVDLGRRRDPTR